MSHTSITEKQTIYLRSEWTWWTTVEIVSLSLDSRLKITPRIFYTFCNILAKFWIGCKWYIFQLGIDQNVSESSRSHGPSCLLLLSRRSQCIQMEESCGTFFIDCSINFSIVLIPTHVIITVIADAQAIPVWLRSFIPIRWSSQVPHRELFFRCGGKRPRTSQPSLDIVC